MVDGPQVIRHWVNIGCFPESTATMIDWAISERAMSESTLEKRTWVMRQAVGLMGVNKWMKRGSGLDSTL